MDNSDQQMDTNKPLEISLNNGFCGLPFGADMQEAEKFFGKPDEQELMDEIEDCLSTLWHYWDKGFTLFFDENDERRFSCVEVRDVNCVLWGRAVFDLSQQELIDLFNENNFAEYETEKHDWGEDRLSYDACNVDFYFIDSKLSSLNYCKPEEEIPYILLPN